LPWKEMAKAIRNLK